MAEVLSPEEWRGAEGKVGVSSELAAILAEERPAALAALCLHGHPRCGFTREDVEHLRKYARSRVTHGHGDHGPPDQYEPWISDLATRIEALLPPKEED